VLGDVLGHLLEGSLPQPLAGELQDLLGGMAREYAPDGGVAGAALQRQLRIAVGTDTAAGMSLTAAASLVSAWERSPDTCPSYLHVQPPASARATRLDGAPPNP
jgi:hypothetical protein